MLEKTPDLKKELAELLKVGCLKWKAFFASFAIGLLLGFMFIAVTPQMYKTSQVAYYKLDLNNIDSNITEIYSMLGKETKDLCGMGQVYDFKLRKRFVLDRFADTVTFVTTSPSPKTNDKCLQNIVADVKANIRTIRRFDGYNGVQTVDQLEPFKLLTEPVTDVVLTHKFKSLIVLACGLGVVGLWLFVKYINEFFAAVIARYMKVHSE